MGPPRRHHTISAFFLRRFAHEDLLTCVSRSDFTKTFENIPENLGVRRDFYAVQRGDGEWSTAIETFLGRQVERFAAPAFRRIHLAGGFPISPADKEDIAMFLAFQSVRGPDNRDSVNSMVEHTVKMLNAAMSPQMIAARLEKMTGDQPTDDEVTAYRTRFQRPDQYKLNLHQNFHIETMLRVAPELVRYFSLRTWNLVTFATPSLATSDVPMVLAGGGGGLMTADAIIVPFDPMHALLLTHPGEEEQVISGTPKLAHEINCEVARSSYEWIFHSPRHNPLVGVSIAPRQPTVTSGIGSGRKFNRIDR